MKRILLIEDDLHDAKKVISLLSSSPYHSQLEVEHSASLKNAREYLTANVPDLVLLDLEFTDENTSSIHLLQDFLISAPVIILSHLSHYQNTLIQYVDVKTFIRKTDISIYLLPAVARILFPAQDTGPEDVVFPPYGSTGINESVTVRAIRFIEKTGKRTYTVYRTDSTVLTISSVSFASLCNTIRKQGITLLQPVSRNEIINTSCIARIYRTEKGRIELILINLSDRVFHVGKKYSEYFMDHFL